MAKKLAATTDGMYHLGKKVFPTVDGVYRKAKKGFLTVNGVHRLVFTGGVDVATLAITYSGTMQDAGVVTMTDGDYRLLTLTSSGTLTVAEEVQAEVWMCGGGMHGGGDGVNAGVGGAGAYTATGIVSIAGTVVASVGSGGGGLSSFGNIQTKGCPSRIDGGTGGGSTQDYGSAGKGDGVDKHPFGDSTYFPNAHCAGGGAGGAYWEPVGNIGGSGGTNGGDGTNGQMSYEGAATGGPGGQVGGGNGANGYLYELSNNNAATFYGSGGGGGGAIFYMGSMIGGTGGAGYQGIIYIRIPVNQAA